MRKNEELNQPLKYFYPVSVKPIKLLKKETNKSEGVYEIIKSLKTNKNN